MSDIAARQQQNLLQQPTNRLEPKLHWKEKPLGLEASARCLSSMGIFSFF